MSGMSRRRFLQTGAAGVLAGSVLGSRGAARARAASGGAARSVSLDAGWRFGGPLVAGSTAPGFDDSAFELVTLPHTVTELSWRSWDPRSWEREWIYRRHFDVPPELRDMRLFLDFGAAMTKASLTLNGEAIGEHVGGYLPFGSEVTGRLRDRGNLLAVALDARFNLNVPPNRPGTVPDTSVDFWQPGGLYRPVSLRGVPQSFIADVFARPVDVLDPSRSVDVRCTVDTARPLADATVRVELIGDGRRVALAEAPVTSDEPGQRTIELRLERLGDVALWNTEHPRLYDVVTTLLVGGRPLHDHVVRIGFRDARFTTEGFFLNGERLQIFGVNRHQFYPFAGAAMPARVQRRDAEIMRRTLRCNFVRCSHYPQSEAFFDACDELGLLAWEEAAGWGTYIGDEEWQGRVVRDVHDMVTRDRNHPSIVIWGARLNENRDDVELWSTTRDVAHALDPSRQTTGAMLSGSHNTPNFVQDVFAQNDYSRRNGQPSLQAPRTDLPYLVSEAIGTLNGPAKFYRRTDPLADQQGQARAHGQVHELAASDPRYCGLIAWSGFDYPSGSGNQWQGVKYTGVVDLFREPKPGAAIYEAQVDAVEQPVIQPAFAWDFGPRSPADGPGAEAMICSNCERLELFVGGEPFASVEPDRERFGHLRYPPSFVDLTVDGSQRPELRIDGYVGGERVLTRSFSSDPAGDRLLVRADDGELQADGSDATRVVFRSVDRYGAPRPYPSGDVTIELRGPATLVGESPFAFEDAGGVGAVWIRSRPGEPGQVRVRVSHAELGAGEVTIAMRHAGRSKPAGAADLTAAAAPALVRAGGTARVSARLLNTGRPALRDVVLTLGTPAGWNAEAAGATRCASVRSGQAVEVSWMVTGPADADPGAVTLVAQAAFSAYGERSGERAEVPLVVPTTLARAFDNVGITSDDDFAGGDLDGVGNTYSREALAAAGLTSGQAFEHDGVTFTWPGEREGEPDNVLAFGQTIALEGSGRVLGIVGCTSRGPITGQGTLHFADGSTDELTLTLDDYFNPPRAESGNESIASTPYLNANSSKADNHVGGKRTHTVYMFYTAVPLPQGKAVAGVTLPKVGNSVAGGPGAMHIFALGVA